MRTLTISTPFGVFTVMSRFSLRLKLALAFLFIAALLVIVSVYQILSMQQFSNQLQHLIDQDISRMNALQDIRLASTRLSDQRTHYIQLLATPGTHSDLQQTRASVVAQANTFDDKLKAYKTSADADQATAQTTNIVSTGSTLITATHAVADPSAPHSITVLQDIQITDAQARFDQAINAATNADRLAIQQNTTQIIKQTADRRLVIGVLAILFIIVAGGMGVIIASRIARSLTLLGSGAERIANGDFSQEIDSSVGGEIGQVAVIFNRMAQRLRDSYRRLALEQQRDEAVLKGMSEGVIAIDEDGRIVIVNQVAIDLLELGDEASVLQKSIHEAYPLYELGTKKDTKITTSKRPSSIALKTGKKVEDVFAFHTKNGAKLQLNIAASPFMVDEKVVGVVTIIRDVTREKEVDRMKTEFISLASHQLRTPLSAIKWFTEMLLNGDAGKLNSEQLEFTNSISESTERMIALVGSLLNISRIESGRIMIVPEPTDLKELVGGIVNDLKAKTEEKQQTLIISVHASLPKVNLDPRLIGQVYLNLLTNAIKYTPKGGEISVFVSKKDDMILSQITDNGYGIPKEQQGRMFEKFFRASNAVKVETDGTGLGLYLIKAVVESSGGKIWFESEEGKGSTFWFTIPLAGMKAKEGEVTLDI
jgi:signal transduction histidine kinase